MRTHNINESTTEEQTMNAQDFLQEALDVMAERGKQYDKPDGERSMARAVAAFNAKTGRDLSEVEGWLLLQDLKDVRQFQNKEKPHMDSLLDCVAYAALKAEAMMRCCDAPKERVSSEWIHWHGDRPFEWPYANVEVVFKDGSNAIDVASHFIWEHDDAPYDIVKYRVILP